MPPPPKKKQIPFFSLFYEVTLILRYEPIIKNFQKLLKENATLQIKFIVGFYINAVITYLKKMEKRKKKRSCDSYAVSGNTLGFYLHPVNHVMYFFLGKKEATAFGLNNKFQFDLFWVNSGRNKASLKSA